MRYWDEKNGEPFLPNLGEDWVLVHQSRLDSRKDRPEIPIPNLAVFEISKSLFEKSQYRLTGRGFGCIDFETWRDFDNPNICSFLFFRCYEKQKTYSRVGMKPLVIDGMIPRDKGGWPLYWESDKTNWPTNKEGEKVKPKTYGKRKTGESDTVQVCVGWLWDDEVAANLPRLILQAKCETLYAHHATVDIIALLSLLVPELHHPLLYFTSSNKDERSRLLFKGSSILTASFDLAPFFDKPYEETKWDYKEKEWITQTEYILEIRDSMGLMPVGLGVLAGTVGMKKTETPEIFTNANHPDFENYMAITPEMIRYAVDDCVILWRSILSFWGLMKEMGYHGKELTLTIGSLGFQMIAHSLRDTHIVKKQKRSWKYRTVHNRPDLDSILRETLVGGRVQVFETEAIESPSISIDANAMYGSVEVLNDRWPDFTKLKVRKYIESSSLENVLYLEGGVHVHWERPESDSLGAVASRDPKTGNLIWSERAGTRWITMVQARFLIERGYTLTPIPYLYERSTVVLNEETGIGEEGETEVQAIYAIVCPSLDFNPFLEVKRWYEKRLELKKAGDPREALVKLLSSAGSFGKWVELNEDIRISCEMDACYSFPDWVFKAVQEIDGEMIGYVKDPILKRAGNTANILGAYITDYARINLLEIGDAIGAEHLLYCDTDSWKISLPLDEVIALLPENTLGRNLGQWGIENEMDFFQAIKPKQYKSHFISKEDSRTGELVSCDIWKMRIKGVNIKGVIEKMWRDEYTFGRPTDDFTLGVLKSLKLSDRMVYERVIGIRESLRRGHDAGKWMEQSKQMRQPS